MSELNQEKTAGHTPGGFGLNRIIAIILIFVVAYICYRHFYKKPTAENSAVVNSVQKVNPLPRVDLVDPNNLPVPRTTSAVRKNDPGPRLVIPVGHLSIEMIRVDHSRFVLGKRDNESGGTDREYPVVLKENYYIGKFEVTQAQYAAVMGENPSAVKNPDFPVDRVSWREAMEFCRKLNQKGCAPAGWMFSLPTEAQWEFAARGGIFSQGFKYSGSNKLDEVGWYDGNSNGSCHPVGRKKANELGLHDMSGNVSEYCLDDFNIDRTGTSHEFVRGDLQNSAERVVRGGSSDFESFHCRMAARNYALPDEKRLAQGFRVVLVKIKEKKAESLERETPHLY